MNLFLNASIGEFQQLIRKMTGGKSVHDLVIDYDGEVLIDPQLEQPELDLDKFKVRLRLSQPSFRDPDKTSDLKKLFLYVMNAWNDIDYSVNSVA